MLNNKNEVVSVLPIQNVNGGYIKKTYAELIEEISPDEIDKLYSYFEQFTGKKCVKKCGRVTLRRVVSSIFIPFYLQIF